MNELEQLFLDGERDEDIGIVRGITAGKMSIEGKDEGIVTSLLIAGMENGLFESAIVVQRANDFRAKAIMTENVEEIIKAKSSKYQFAPTVKEW